MIGAGCGFPSKSRLEREPFVLRGDQSGAGEAAKAQKGATFLRWHNQSERKIKTGPGPIIFLTF